MKRILELELDITTDLPPLELASKVEQAVREATETVNRSFGTELAFNIFFLLDGHEVRLVMEPV